MNTNAGWTLFGGLMAIIGMFLAALLLAGCAGPNLPGSPERAYYDLCMEGGTRTDQSCRNEARLATWPRPSMGVGVLVPLGR